MNIQSMINKASENTINSEEFIITPSETDILCGRGGASIHHPGNIWYRNLLRFARDWYRLCPKHTKLLMSKTIANAIQKQGRRFLIRLESNGIWYPASNKKAIQKTSQALRERERDQDDSESRFIAIKGTTELSAESSLRIPQSMKEILQTLKQIIKSHDRVILSKKPSQIIRSSKKRYHNLTTVVDKPKCAISPPTHQTTIINAHMIHYLSSSNNMHSSKSINNINVIFSSLNPVERMCVRNEILSSPIALLYYKKLLNLN